MKWVDVCAGPMSSGQIGKEIRRYLRDPRRPDKLLVTIERKGQLFHTKIYMTVDDFKSASEYDFKIG